VPFGIAAVISPGAGLLEITMFCLFGYTGTFAKVES
jgi:hypothetical protein